MMRANDNIILKVPEDVSDLAATLVGAGYPAYVVGGAVRDLLLGLTPRDWDMSTPALPETVCKLFSHTFDTGLKHGTVTVLTAERMVEVTTFRSDGPGRKPDVRFGASLEEDLQRRDFTINAMAYDPLRSRFVDPFGAIADLCRRKIIVKATDPYQRFTEDPLRMLRAVSLVSRFAPLEDQGYIVLLDPATLASIKSDHQKILEISRERVRDQLSMMLLDGDFSLAAKLLLDTGLLKDILPELAATAGVDQGSRWHRYDVFHHLIETVQNCRKDLVLRLAALWHDAAKPLVRQQDGQLVHFYRHETPGARMASACLRRLKYPRHVIADVTNLVSNHMFSYPSTPAGVKRLISRVGERLVGRLFELRKADIKASLVDEIPPELINLENDVRELLERKEPLGISDLAINGRDIMIALQIGEGPKVRCALEFLLDRVLNEPWLNTRENLLNQLYDFHGQVEKKK